MRRLLGPALLACVGCATPLGRLGALEKRVDVIESVLGIQQDAVAQAPRLGGPEASAPVASAGAWVPVQAARVAALGGLGGPGLTGGSSPTFSGTVTSGAASGSNGFVLQTGAYLCFDGSSCTQKMRFDGTYVATTGVGKFTNGLTTDYVIASKPSGFDALLFSASGARLHLGTGTSDYLYSDGTGIQTPGYLIANDTTFGIAAPAIRNSSTATIGTTGSGTGITTNVTAWVQPFLHKITVARTALTAAAATQDITLWTVSAKTRIVRLVADVTAAFDDGASPISAVTITCGSSAGGAQYLASGSVFTVNTLGDVAAEIGAGLTSATLADIPSMSATTAVQCRFTSTGGNLSTLTTGSATFYIEGVQYP